jgi:predicted RNA-binding protein with TRAM domain
MPRRLPEKTREIQRRPRKFGRKTFTSPYTTLFKTIPVKEGDELEVTIDDIGSRGDGITRVQGFLIFVPRTKVGEKLRVKIVKVERGFAVAEKIEEGVEKEV